jgi:hypothetical protein
VGNINAGNGPKSTASNGDEDLVGDPGGVWFGDPAARFDEEVDPRASEEEGQEGEDLANADANDRVTRPGRIDTGVGMVMLVRVEVEGESGDWTCIGGC